MRRTAGRPTKVDLKPSRQRRGKGTLQRGLCPISNASWRYDGQPLVLALICQRKWAPTELNRQRVALIVSLFHDDSSLDLYMHVAQHTRVYQHVNVRVQA